MEICWSLARVSLPGVPAPPFEIEAAIIQQKSNDATVNSYGSWSDQRAIADTYSSVPRDPSVVPRHTPGPSEEDTGRRACPGGTKRWKRLTNERHDLRNYFSRIPSWQKEQQN